MWLFELMKIHHENMERFQFTVRLNGRLSQPEFPVDSRNISVTADMSVPVTKLTVELSQQLSGGSPHVTMETRKL